MAYTIIKQISSGILRYRALIDLEEGTISYCYGDFDEVFRSRMRKFEPLARSPLAFGAPDVFSNMRASGYKAG